MYRVTWKVEIEDDIIERFTPAEWERILVNHDMADRDEMPLNYENVAEILVREYWAADNVYWLGPDAIKPTDPKMKVTQTVEKE